MTELGNTDDSEGLTLFSNPPSPPTPLPSWFDFYHSNLELDPNFLSPAFSCRLTPLAPSSELDSRRLRITLFTSRFLEGFLYCGSTGQHYTYNSKMTPLTIECCWDVQHEEKYRGNLGFYLPLTTFESTISY